MRRRTPAARRGITALAASSVAVLLGFLLAPTAASAVPGQPEPGVTSSSVYWDVRDESGELVGGASFAVVGERGATADSAVVVDCPSSGCVGDLDPDAGELQASGVGSGNWDLRVTPTAPPAGYVFIDSDARVANFKDGGPQGIGTYRVRSTAPAVLPAASCVAGTYYALLDSGTVRRVVNGAVSTFGGWSMLWGSTNALGISASGRTMYAVERRAFSSDPDIRSILRFTTSDGWQRLSGTSYSTSGVTVVGGAISPTTGNYLFGGFTTSNGQLVFDLHRFTPSTGAIGAVGRIETGLTIAGANGDMAFDGRGNLSVMYSSGSTLHTFTVPANALGANGGTLAHTASTPTSALGLSNFNGIAVGADGAVAMSNSTTLRRFDPITFATIDTPSTSLATMGTESTDLASCGTPPSLSLTKVVDGRAQPEDEFRVELGTGTTTHRSATTTAGATTATIAALTVRAGASYTVRDLMASGAAVGADYAIGFACTNATTGGTGAVRTVAVAAGATASCTFTNSSMLTRLTLRKDIQDVDGGGQRAARDWTVGAVASGSVAQAPAVSGGASLRSTGADGSASWTIRHTATSAIASIAISEVQQRGYELQSLTCSVRDRAGVTATSNPSTTWSSATSTVSATVPNVAPGSTVDCRFVNRELPTTLTLVNEAHGGKPATEWQLAAAGPSGSLAGPSGATGTTAASARVTPGVAYALTASGTPATYVAEGPWSCVDGARAVVPVTASGSVTLQRGSSATCTIVHSTARLVLLQQVEGAGGLEAADFQVTASPASGTPALAATTRTGTDAVGTGSTIEVRPGRAYELTSTSDAIHIPLRLERHDGTLLPDGSLDPEHWTTATVTTATVDARGIAYYRFVALSPLPFALPVTGGIGADLYQLGGLGLLVLAIGALVVRPLGRRLSMTRMTIPNTPAPQEGTAPMAIISKSRSARVAAGLGAVAIATLAAFGAAAPASAAPDNIDPTEPRSLTIHKFAEPETATGLSNDGTAIDAADLAGLTPLEGVEFTIQRVGTIDLTTSAGWAAAQGLTPATATALGLGTAVDGETDEDGVVQFTGLAAAVYLVTETDHGANDIAFQADPFLVTVPMPADNEWIYDVHVYPKNSVTGIDKTFADGLLQGVGDRATWTIRADVPEVAAGKSLPSFVISDTLDPRLTYLDATVTANNLSLDDADYVLDVSGQTVTVTVTNLAKLAAADNASIEVEIVTTVSSLAAPTAGDEDGVISNDATLTIDGTDFTSGPVKTEWATLAILAHELRDPATDRSGVLAGAEFQIFASKADYDARTNPISVGGRSTFESGDNGVALVGTLPAGQYWILETKAPAGYEVRESIAPVTLVGGEISTTEIDAYVPHAQVPAYALPVTGGDGQLMFMLGGAGLVLLAVGFALVRSRKAEQQA